MGKINVWWELNVEDRGDLTDADREHIAKAIQEGFDAGQLIPDEEETEKPIAIKRG